MAHEKYRNDSIKIECNVTSIFLNPKQRSRTKTSHYSPILQVCMNNHSERVKFKNFQILLDSGRSSTIIMGNLTSKLKAKETSITMW